MTFGLSLLNAAFPTAMNDSCIIFRARTLLSILLLAAAASSCSRSVTQESTEAKDKKPSSDIGYTEPRQTSTKNGDVGGVVNGRPIPSSQVSTKAPISDSVESPEITSSTPNAASSLGLSSDETDAKSSAKDSLSAALGLQRSAKDAANAGKVDIAYTRSLTAWQSLREHSDDTACRALAADLLNELKAYGDQLSADPSNQPAGGVIRKPIRFE